MSDGQADAALSFDDGWKLAFRNATDAPMLTDAVRTFQIEQNAAASGVVASQILAHTELTMVPLDGNESNTIALLIATFAFAILFMFSAMTFGMQIAQSVVTEKESRIVEILAAAVPIRQLLIGKVVGNSLLALSQVVLIVAAALVGMSFTEYKSMIALVAPVAGWFVLFSSHQLELVERLCDQIVILRKGQVIATGSVDELRSAGPARHAIVADADLGWLRGRPGVTVVDVDGPKAEVEFADDATAQHVLAEALSRGPVRSFGPIVRPLSDYYREVTR